MSNKDEIKNVLTTTMLVALREESFKLSIKNMVKNELEAVLLSDKKEFFLSKAYKDFEESLTDKIKDFGNSLEFKNSLHRIFNDKFLEIEGSNYTFSKLIPTTFVNSLKVYVYNNKDNIALSIKNLLNNKKLQERIKTEITKAIGSLNPMAAKFINGDKIYSKISLGINSYFDNEENLMDMVMMISDGLDKLMQKKVSDFLTYLPVEGKSSLIDTLCNIIANNLFSSQVISKVMANIREKLNDKTFTRGLLNTNQKILSSLINDFSDKYYEMVLESTKLKEVIDTISDLLVDKLLEMPMKNFI